MKSKWIRTKTLGSQFLNVWIFDGHPDETISGRSHREGEIGGDPAWAKRAAIINRVAGNPDHCKRSHEADVAFAGMILAAHAAAMGADHAKITWTGSQTTISYVKFEQRMSAQSAE